MGEAPAELEKGLVALRTSIIATDAVAHGSLQEWVETWIYMIKQIEDAPVSGTVKNFAEPATRFKKHRDTLHEQHVKSSSCTKDDEQVGTEDGLTPVVLRKYEVATGVADAKPTNEAEGKSEVLVGGAESDECAVSLWHTLTEMLHDADAIARDMNHHYEMMFGEEQHKGLKLSKDEFDLCFASMQLEMNKRAISDEHRDAGYQVMTHSEPRGSAAPALFFKMGESGDGLKAALAFCVDVIVALF